MKILYKLIRDYYYRKSGRLLHHFLAQDKISLIDVGSAGGLGNRWEPFHKNIKAIGFEPDDRKSEVLGVSENNEGSLIINKPVWSSETSLTIYHTKKPFASSAYKPNIDYYKNFLDVERFDIEFEKEYQAVTISKVCKKLSVIPDFIKIDAQGGELEILKGVGSIMENVLGVEAEVEFKTCYIGQPLFPEIMAHMESVNFSMIDFVALARMERNAFRGIGESVFADALFLRSPEYIVEKYKKQDIDDSILKRYCAILFIYHRHDLLITVSENLSKGKIADSIVQDISKLTLDTKKKTWLICLVSKYASYIINLFGIDNKVHSLY